MMKKLLAIAMLGIFLVSITCATPVTAAHQRSFVDKISSLEDSIKKLSKNTGTKDHRFKILSALKVLLNILRTILVWVLSALRIAVNLSIFVLNIISKILGILIVLLS